MSLDPKKPGETISMSFRLAALGAAITGSSVTLVWRSGVADSPISLISGPTNLVGTDLVVPISGGIAGADYLVRLAVDLADGQHLIEDAVLSVRD
jgi:hypothetical protein